MAILMGIDPGLSGGIAVVDSPTGELLHSERMPTVELRGKKIVDAGAIPAVFYHEQDDVYLEVDRFIIEQVSAMPRQGVTSSFRFGMAYGAVLAFCQRSGLPFELVTPAVWKKHFGLSSSKKASLDACQMRFGQGGDWALADDGRAEAALLCAWWIDKAS